MFKRQFVPYTKLPDYEKGMVIIMERNDETVAEEKHLHCSLDFIKDNIHKYQQ